MKSFTDYLNEKMEKMDPRQHSVERDGKFVVVDKEGKVVKTFDDKEAADKYAVANHDKLMEGCGCDGTNEEVSSKDAGRIGAAISNRKDLPASEKNVARRSLQRKVARAQRKEKAFNVNADAGSRYRVGTKRPADSNNPKHKELVRSRAVSRSMDKDRKAGYSTEAVKPAMRMGVDFKYKAPSEEDKATMKREREKAAKMRSTPDTSAAGRAAQRMIDARKKTEESVEQVDELKSDTLRSYLDKARKDNQTRVTRMADQPSSVPADKGEMQKLRKRRKGSEAAASRLDARKHNLEPSLKREDVEQVDELKMPKGGLEKGTFKNPALMLKLLTTGGKGKRKRKVQEEKKDKIKIELDPKKKIGYEVRSVGPGGKTTVTKRRDMPGQEDVGEASAAWQRKEGKNKEGGLNAAGRASYERENPGSDLKAPVSAEQAKKSKGGKAAKRRKSFCARMGGMPGAMKDEKGRPTRKALALRKWDC